MRRGLSQVFPRNFVITPFHFPLLRTQLRLARLAPLIPLMTHDRATTRTNPARLVAEAARADEMLDLNRSAEALVPRTEKGRRVLVLLACQEKQLLSLRRRLMEAALTELLWQYQDYVEGTDTGYVVRQLITDIGIR
jgi:hypothetical protein